MSVIRLKDLLLEEDEVKKARDLDKVFQNGKVKNDIEFLLWRGMEGVKIETWNWFEIPTDFDDSHMYFKKHTKNAVYALERFVPKDMPYRNRSAWTSPQKSKAEDFGKPYVCFIHEDAKIGCWEKDGVNYFHLMDSYFSPLYAKRKLNDEVSKEDEKFYMFWVYIKSSQWKNFADMIWNDFQYLKKKFHEYYGDDPAHFGGFDNKGEVYTSAIRQLREYVKDMKKGVHKECLDVMFSDAPYILANGGFFKTYFSWNGGEWRLKHKYRD